MSKHIETGQFGETYAEKYLVNRGYIILERNYRFKRSEIDIISVKNDILIFTEVKTRNGGTNNDPTASIDDRKISRLKAGAAKYMEENEYDWSYQFDIISIVLHDTDIEVDHYEDVFF